MHKCALRSCQWWIPDSDPKTYCSPECIAAYVADQHDDKACDDPDSCPVCQDFGPYQGVLTV